jgi:NAD(P)-dependent dehydrogenase (short-subunit alcohol dehydrogenase family)
VELQGRVAVVTGGASGIGRGTALALARAGADVVVADINQERMEDVVDTVKGLGQKALAVRCDVTSDEEVDALARTTVEEFGRVDVVHLNAGVSLLGPPERVPMADWKWLFEINLFGVVRGIRAFVPILLEQGSGHLVTTGSVAGLYAHGYDNIPYFGCKYGVVGMTEGLYLYLKPKGIGVSVLCPGSVATNMVERVRIIGVDDFSWINIPEHMHRTIQPEEVGEKVVEAIREERFLILTHPEDRQWVDDHGRDREAFLNNYIPRIYEGRDKKTGMPLAPAE